MSNQVKQLELDFGMLTVAQQETVDRFVSRSKRNADDASARTAKIEALLISGGFKAGIDYVNTLEIKTITEDREFGYGDDEFSAEVGLYALYCDVTVEHSNLSCSILTNTKRADILFLYES